MFVAYLSLHGKNSKLCNFNYLPSGFTHWERFYLLYMVPLRIKSYQRKHLCQRGQMKKDTNKNTCAPLRLGEYQALMWYHFKMFKEVNFQL